MQALIDEIRSKFSDERYKQLLIAPYVEPPSYWYDINKNSVVPSTGFCYVASEVFYKLNGGAKKYWFRKLLTDKLPYNGQHFFLMDKETNEIVDLTADQFGELDIPYHEAKNIGLRFTSKRCNEFIKLMNQDRENA